VEITIEELRRYKSPGIDKISAELIKQEVMHYVLRSTYLLILFVIRKSCHSGGRNLLLYLFMERVIELTVLIAEGCYCFQLHTRFYPVFLSHS
jgi:hypothetical protein